MLTIAMSSDLRSMNDIENIIILEMIVCDDRVESLIVVVLCMVSD